MKNERLERLVSFECKRCDNKEKVVEKIKGFVHAYTTVTTDNTSTNCKINHRCFCSCIPPTNQLQAITNYFVFMLAQVAGVIVSDAAIFSNT